MADTLAVNMGILGGKVHGGIYMSEGQMILMFCLIYSGALSLAIWANLVARQRMQAYIRTDADGGPGKSSAPFKQGA